MSTNSPKTERGHNMKPIYTITDDEILEELFSGMTQLEIDAYVNRIMGGKRV